MNVNGFLDPQKPIHGTPCLRPLVPTHILFSEALKRLSGGILTQLKMSGIRLLPSFAVRFAGVRLPRGAVLLPFSSTKICSPYHSSPVPNLSLDASVARLAEICTQYPSLCRQGGVRDIIYRGSEERIRSALLPDGTAPLVRPVSHPAFLTHQSYLPLMKFQMFFTLLKGCTISVCVCFSAMFW